MRPIPDRRAASMLDVMDQCREKPWPNVLGGRYELLDRAGQGGMSVVWRAWDRVDERLVAVKVPAGAYAVDPGVAGRLRREGRLTAAVSHPGVVRVHEYVEHDGPSGPAPSLVLEYLPEPSLQHRLATSGTGPAVALRTGAQIAAALAAIHGRGIVHCDLSAANVVPDGDVVKVIDFGIATPVGSRIRQGNSFEVLGTPAYLAPERLTEDVARPEMDIFALGVLLYRLLSGRSPWPADSGTQAVAAHVMHEPAPLPRSPAVSAEIVALCGRCLAKDPALRPAAEEAERLLRRAAGEFPATRVPAGFGDAGLDPAPVVVPYDRPDRRRALPAAGRRVGAGRGAASDHGVRWWPIRLRRRG